MVVKLTTPKVKVFDQVQVNIAAIAEAITFNTQITACEVTMPIQVTGSNIMLPIDVQSSFVMLPIDIQGQIGELNIKCGDVAGNVNICIASAQKVGILLQPEWAAKEQLHKQWAIQLGGIASGSSDEHTFYTVPSSNGKTLFITGVGGSVKPTSSENYANRTRVRYALYKIIDETPYPLLFAGFAEGCLHVYPQPFRYPGGSKLHMNFYNYGPDAADIQLCPYGYEV